LADTSTRCALRIAGADIKDKQVRGEGMHVNPKAG
jgi:hypothetical protein